MVKAGQKTTEYAIKAKKSEIDSFGVFDKSCFVEVLPSNAKHGEDVPMWWSIIRESGVTFKQYKKDKKRAEKEIAGLEEYLKKLQDENKKYSEKLKKESEKYKLEKDMKEHAFIERRKKEELTLSAEKEEAKKRILEEKLLIQQKQLKLSRAKDEENDRIRELDAKKKFDAELERIGEIEKSEINTIKKTDKSKRADKSTILTIKQQKAKRELDEKRRIELLDVTERETYKKLRRAHKIKDYEFIYPLASFGAQKKDNVIEFSALCLKRRKDGKYLSSPVYAVIGKGVTVSSELSSREISAICSALTRQVDKDNILSGGVRFETKLLLHELDDKKQRKLVGDKIAIFDGLPKIKGLTKITKIGSYISGRVGQDKVQLALDYLQRLNIRDTKAFCKKSALSCSIGELARVDIVCALLSSADLTVLIKPQKLLDAPTVHALSLLIGEWNDKDRALWILSSEEDFCK